MTSGVPDRSLRRAVSALVWGRATPAQMTRIGRVPEPRSGELVALAQQLRVLCDDQENREREDR